MFRKLLDIEFINQIRKSNENYDYKEKVNSFKNIKNRIKNVFAKKHEPPEEEAHAVHTTHHPRGIAAGRLHHPAPHGYRWHYTVSLPQ